MQAGPRLDSQLQNIHLLLGILKLIKLKTILCLTLALAFQPVSEGRVRLGVSRAGEPGLRPAHSHTQLGIRDTEYGLHGSNMELGKGFLRHPSTHPVVWARSGSLHTIPHAVNLPSLSWPGTASREADEAVIVRALSHVHTCHKASGLQQALLLFPKRAVAGSTKHWRAVN